MTEKVTTTLPTYHGRGKWSPDATKLLVAYYQQQPCLYERSHPHYRNKPIRQQALETITQLLDKDMQTNFNSRDILTKINSIRTQFSVVHNSRAKRLSTNQDPSSLKQPSWWLYPHLNFLVENYRKNGRRGDPIGTYHLENNNNASYQNNESCKMEVLDAGNEEESDEDALNQETYEEQEFIDAEQKLNANIVMESKDVNTNEAIVQEIVCTPVQNFNPKPELLMQNQGESQRPETRPQYVSASINHLQVELEAIRNPQTQRILLRKMLQMVYDAQDQEQERRFISGI